MKRMTAATPILTATALLCAPAAAHHSQSMFDTTKEIVVEGTVSRFDWVNPHMYIVVATKGPDGRPALRCSDSADPLVSSCSSARAAGGAAPVSAKCARRRRR